MEPLIAVPVSGWHAKGVPGGFGVDIDDSSCYEGTHDYYDELSMFQDEDVVLSLSFGP